MTSRLEKGVFFQQNPVDSREPGLDIDEPTLPIDSSTAFGKTVLGLAGTYLTIADAFALDMVEKDPAKLVKNAMPEGANVPAEELQTFTKRVLLEVISVLERLWESEKSHSPEEERLFGICERIKRGSRNPLPRIARDIFRRLSMPIPPEYAKRQGSPAYEQELVRLMQLLPPGTVSADGHVYTEEEIRRLAMIKTALPENGVKSIPQKPEKKQPKKPKRNVNVQDLLERPYYVAVMEARNNGDLNAEIARRLGITLDAVRDITSKLIHAGLIKERGRASEQTLTSADLKTLHLLYLTPEEESVPRDVLTDVFYETHDLKPKDLAGLRLKTPSMISYLNYKLRKIFRLPKNAKPVISNIVNPYGETGKYQMQSEYKQLVKEIFEKNGISLSEKPGEIKPS